MNTTKSKFLEILGRHSGKDNPIPLDELAARLGVSTRTAQDLKHTLIVDDGYLIGSTTGNKVSGRHGIFLITSDGDRRVARLQILNRMRSLGKVLRVYDRSPLVEEMLGQLQHLEEV